MALDNVTSHFSTMLELFTSASFLSSLSIIHENIYEVLNFIYLFICLSHFFFFYYTTCVVTCATCFVYILSSRYR